MAHIQYLKFDDLNLPLPNSYDVDLSSVEADSSGETEAKIAVEYFDTEDLELKKTEMYIDGYKAKLEKDTSYKGLWSVSFTLNEF